MSRYIQIVTPENIEIEYELAGIGSRFTAALIDHLLILLCVIVIWTVGYTVVLIQMSANVFGDAPLWTQAVLTILSFVTIVTFPIVFELRGNGQSPGKKVSGLRVIRDGGYPIEPQSSIIRNVVRIADIMPGGYGVGLITLFFSSQNKRLGDIAAGTIVIKDRISGDVGTSSSAISSPAADTYLAYIKSIDGITEDQFSLIRKFLLRVQLMDKDEAAVLAQHICYPILPKIGINFQVSHPHHYLDILEAVQKKRSMLEEPIDQPEPILD